MLGDEREQRSASPTRADHLVAGVLEQAGEALAQQYRVLGDHDPHGSTASIRVPAPPASMRSVRRARPPGR